MNRTYSVLAAAFFCAALSFGQEFRGSLGGRVLDQQRAVVPGAKIHLVNSQTGAKFQTVAGADGSYLVPFLPPGQYSITAESAGFKRYVNQNVPVTTNEREQLDITLEVGQVDQSVTVTAESAMLETGT